MIRRKYELDPAALKWLMSVADAITSVGPPPENYDLADIFLEWDGEFTGLGIGGSEHGHEYTVVLTEIREGGEDA